MGERLFLGMLKSSHNEIHEHSYSLVVENAANKLLFKSNIVLTCFYFNLDRNIVINPPEMYKAPKKLLHTKLMSVGGKGGGGY